MSMEEARLHRAQRAFRKVLDAFARPGTVREIEVAGDGPAAAHLGGALAAAVELFVDQAVTFAVAGDGSDQAEEALAAGTRAAATALPRADFVIASGGAAASAEAVRGAGGGTPLSPEKGATVIILTGRVSEGPGDGLVSCSVSGPGVRDENRFYVDDVAWLAARNDRCDEFPCGVDVLLVDDGARVVARPRTSQVRCGKEAGEPGAM